MSNLVHVTLHNRWASKTTSFYRDMRLAGIPHKGETLTIIEAPYQTETVMDVVWSTETGVTVHVLSIIDPALLIDNEWRPAPVIEG